MRILCDDFGGLEVGTRLAASEHEVVRITKDQVLAAWEQPRDWWRALVPAGWQPDAAVFWSPEYTLLPPSVWDLPCPVALWSGDWYMDPNGLRQLAPHVDAILCDAVGTRRLRAAGVERVLECSPWTYVPGEHQPDLDAEPLYDVSFVGSLNDVIHVERNRWLQRVLELPAQYRVRVDAGIFGEEYGEILRRSRIGFNHTVAGGVNMRCFEICASGSLLFVERSNTEVARLFRDRVECVLYGEDDFEQLVDHYLTHEDERRAIAEAGWRRVQELAPASIVPQLLERLVALAAGGIVRTQPDAVRAAKLNAFEALHMPTPPRPYTSLELMLEEAEAPAGEEDSGLFVARAAMYLACAATLPAPQQQSAIQGALEYAERAVAADPSDAVALFDQAALYAMIGASPAAEKALRRLLDAIDAGTASADPDRLVLRTAIDDFTMAWLATSLELGAAAGPELTRMLAGEAAERLASLSTVPAEQVALLRRAVDARPVATDARRKLGAALATAGDLEGALEQIELVLAQKPLLDVVSEERVALLVALGRLDEAAGVAADVARIADRMPRRRPLAERLAGRVAAAAPTVRPV